MTDENNIDPTPKQGERIIWRHKGIRTKASDDRVFPPNWYGGWAQRIIFVLIYAFWGWYLFTWHKNLKDNSIGLQDIDFMKIGFMVILLIILIFSLKAAVKYSKKNVKTMPQGAIPLWLSEERLALAADGDRKDLFIKTKDITSAIMDYSEGSPSIALKTSKRDYTLISSDRDKLINHLYTIRPDLMIAS